MRRSRRRVRSKRFVGEVIEPDRARPPSSTMFKPLLDEFCGDAPRHQKRSPRHLFHSIALLTHRWNATFKDRLVKRYCDDFLYFRPILPSTLRHLVGPGFVISILRIYITILIYFNFIMEILIPDRSKSRFVSIKKLENTRKIPLSKKDGCKVREASIE